MTLKDYAQSYSESTDSFLEAVSLVTTENIDIADHAGWTVRQIVHHMADSESQAAMALIMPTNCEKRLEKRIKVS
jgi:hypothetical protein